MKLAELNEKFLVITGFVTIFVCLAATYWFSEKIPFNGGFGWDGAIYARMVEHFQEDLASGKIDAYYIKRILPSLLVMLPARVAGIQITSSYIINGFIIANIVNIGIVLFYWLRTSRLLNLTVERTMVGVCLLAMCFPVIKFHAYLPVLTDSFAYSTAMMIMYYYLAGKKLKLALVVFLSFFIWNGAVYSGILLLLFPRDVRMSVSDAHYVRLRNLISNSLVMAALYVIIWVLFIKKISISSPGYVTELNWVLLPFSISAVLGYVWWVARCAAESVYRQKTANIVGLSNVNMMSMASVLIASALILVFQKYISHGYGFRSTIQIGIMMWCSIKQPLMFLVAGTTYYGLTVPFMSLDLKGCLRRSHELGLGFMLSLIYGLTLGISAEPRCYINILPLMVLVIILSERFDNLTRKQWVILLTAQFCFSKAWLSIQANPLDFETLQSPVAQRLFMNIGTWMSDKNYLYHLLAMFIAIALVAQFFKPKRIILPVTQSGVK